MTQTKKDQKVNFQLKAIELLNVGLNHPETQLPLNTRFHFNINLEHKINLDMNIVAVVTNIEILNEDKKLKLASLKVSCVFEIITLADFFDMETNQTTFPEPVLITLNSISISTIRGIMFSEFKGTFLHNAILPVIDPKSFVKNN